MQPNYISLNKIFGPQGRYVVPLFQRPYVWKQDSQWEPLWEDVKGLSERVLAAGPSKPISGHFLGTAVLEQTATQTGTVPCREVIDGQQRLTTLQILLHATQHAMEAALASREWDEAPAKKLSVSARQISLLTNNPAFGDDEEKYKVWPTNDDRAAFIEVLDSTGPGGLTGKVSLMAQAYRYFFKEAEGWIGAGEAVPRCEALANALGNHLRLIVLDLDDSDEPQAIFETLNAHGTPLLPADLVKNRLLWEATRQELALKHLYESYWRPFDSDTGFWRALVGTGHAARPRIDVFLQSWLTGRTLDPVPVKHLYQRFLGYVATLANASDGGKLPVENLLADISSDARNYRFLASPTGCTRFADFVRRLTRLDIVVFDPLLLALMRRAASSPEDLDNVAKILESYLVRRTVCSAQTRGYGTLALKLLAGVEAAPPSLPAAPIIQDLLLSEQGGTLGWPDDDQFWAFWSERQFYGNLKRDRVLMVLQAIEQHYQLSGKLAEPVVSYDFSKLQVEHILPQSWEAEWSPPKAPLTHEQRQLKLHGIGNLTLVSGPLNAKLSNAAWTYPADNDGVVSKGKRDAVDEFSFLSLNKRLVSSYPDSWDERGMLARAAELYQVAIKLWPGPADMAVQR